MRRLILTTTAAVLAATIAIAAPVSAHDDGEGGDAETYLEVLAEEFESVVAANAAEGSNAPTGHAPCIKGLAADTYPCDGVDMLSHLTLDDLGTLFVNDLWGWTDPVTGSDYALVGTAQGVVIVDISDPKRPDIVGTLPFQTNQPRVIWRDMKVYQDHMFVVAEDGGSGIQVFDLTEVRGVTGDPVTFATTASYFGFDTSHNIAINEDSGYAYVVGTDTCGGGLHMVDISDPLAPSFAGCATFDGYVHDTQCVIYNGPDEAYRGHEICFNAAAQFFGFSPAGIVNTVEIVDVTDKSNPVQLSTHEYSNDGYSHQGWLTPDHQYFLHNDELDEFFYGSNTSTRIFDVRDLDSLGEPAYVDHPNTSIGHNAYTEGRYAYAANYTSGLRVYSTTDVADGELPEVAYFDVYPENDDATFAGGAWSSYPYFAQKKVVAVSSSDRGLFILQPRVGS